MENYTYTSTQGGKEKELYAVRATRREKSATARQYQKEGRVMVQYDPDESGAVLGGWELKTDCVWDRRRQAYRRKIDFVCEHMGGKAVEAELRSIVGEKATVSDLVGAPNWIPSYRAKIEELVKTVQGAGL